MTTADSLAARAAQERTRGSGFWTVAYAFLIVMAFATLPSPLYGLYRTRDHLSALMITVVYAIFAAGTIVALLGVRSIAARHRAPRRDARCCRNNDGGGWIARLMEGPARTSYRAAAHRSISRARCGHRNHVPDRVAPPSGSERLDGTSVDHRNVGERRRTRSRPVARRPPGAVGEAAAHVAVPRDPCARSDRARRPVVRARDRSADATRDTDEPAGRFTLGQASSSGSSRNACGLRREWTVRWAVRALLGHHASPSVARVVRRHALFGVFFRSRVAVGDCQARKRHVCSHSARSPCLPVSYFWSSRCVFRSRTSLSS